MLMTEPRRERISYEEKPHLCSYCRRYLGGLDMREGSITLKCHYCKRETTLVVRPPQK